MDSQIGFPPLTMAVFVGIALGALLLDMVTHRGDKPISLAKASIWSIFWIAISLAFAGFLYVQHGPDVATLFVEARPETHGEAERAAEAASLAMHIRNNIGIGIKVVVGDPGAVERSAGKARRVIDKRPKS